MTVKDTAKKTATQAIVSKLATFAIPAIIGTVIIAIPVLFSAVQIVQPGEVRTVTYFGELQEETLDEGLHIINPLKSTRTYDVKSQTYTMSAGEGDRTIEALTKEGLNLETMDISLRYHLNRDSAKSVHRNLGDMSTIRSKLIKPSIRTAVRMCTAEYTSREIYSVGRQELPSCIKNATVSEFKDTGTRDYTQDFTIEAVQVRNIQLPQQVRNKIQEKKQTEQELEIQTKKVEISKKKKRQNEIVTESLTKPVLTEKFIKALDETDTTYIPVGESGYPKFVQNLNNATAK